MSDMGRSEEKHDMKRSRRPFHVAMLMAAFLLLAGVLGCETTSPTPSIAPTPTPTPTPEPTPTAEPTAAFVPADGASATVAVEGVLGELLAAIPSGYGHVVFVDSQTIIEDPILRQEFIDLGGLAILGPIAGPLQEQLNQVVLATDEEAGIVGVLRGPLNIGALVRSVETLGGGVESETYGEFQVQTLEVKTRFLTLSLALSALDETTAVFAISLTTESTSADLAKAALDTLEGSTAGFLSHPVAGQLVVAVPQGFALLVSLDCALFFEELAGCTGISISSQREGETGIIGGVLAFGTSELAQEAVLAIQEGLAAEDPEVTGLFEDTEITLEGNLVRLKSEVSLDEALSTVLDSLAP